MSNKKTAAKPSGAGLTRRGGAAEGMRPRACAGTNDPELARTRCWNCSYVIVEDQPKGRSALRCGNGANTGCRGRVTEVYPTAAPVVLIGRPAPAWCVLVGGAGRLVAPERRRAGSDGRASKERSPGTTRGNVRAEKRP